MKIGKPLRTVTVPRRERERAIPAPNWPKRAPKPERIPEPAWPEREKTEPHKEVA
jgi:hypothetical protein